MGHPPFRFLGTIIFIQYGIGKTPSDSLYVAIFAVESTSIAKIKGEVITEMFVTEFIAWEGQDCAGVL